RLDGRRQITPCEGGETTGKVGNIGTAEVLSGVLHLLQRAADRAGNEDRNADPQKGGKSSQREAQQQNEARGSILGGRLLLHLAFDGDNIQIGGVQAGSERGIGEMAKCIMKLACPLKRERGFRALVVATPAKVESGESLYVLTLPVAIGQCIRLGERLADLLD